MRIDMRRCSTISNTSRMPYIHIYMCLPYHTRSPCKGHQSLRSHGMASCLCRVCLADLVDYKITACLCRLCLAQPLIKPRHASVGFAWRNQSIMRSSHASAGFAWLDPTLHACTRAPQPALSSSERRRPSSNRIA